MELQDSITHLVPDCTCQGKQCSKCRDERGRQCIEAFHRHKYSLDGRRSICKACRKIEHSTEEFKANRRAKHKDNAEHINEKKREWYHSNAEHEREQAQKYRDNNPEKITAYINEYNRSERGKARYKTFRERHPEIGKARRKTAWQAHEYVNVELAAHQNHFTQSEWNTLKAHYDYRCLCCHRQEPDIKLTVDHIIPLSQTIRSTIDNIQPLCRSCNSRKGTKIIDYRIEEQKHG